jgi:hypothetical protein
MDRDEDMLLWPVKDARGKLKSRGEAKLYMIQLRIRRKRGSMFKI